MPVLARLLGLRAMIAPTAFALTLHELAHLICARMLRAQIAEIRLMPFGGSIRLENPYLLRPVQIMLIAAAGPAGNLAGTICAAAAAHFHLLSPRIAAQFIQASTILMLFNLFHRPYSGVCRGTDSNRQCEHHADSVCASAVYRRTR